MKKFFKKATLVLGIMGMGLTTTSCGTEEIINGIINNGGLDILQQLLGNIFNNGTVNNYSGRATCQYLYGNMTDQGFDVEGQTKEQVVSGTVQATCKKNAVTITLPTMTVTEGDAKATIDGITIYDMVLDEKGNLSIGENSTIAGTLLAPDGETYNFYAPYFTSATISNSELKMDVSLYFGEDCKRVMNVDFTGTIVTNAQ